MIVSFIRTKISSEKSKTDIYREGSWVLIAKTFTDTCPVNMLIQYSAKFKLPPSSEQYIFSGFTFSEKQNKHIFRKKNKPLSYTRIRETIFSALEKIVYQSKNLGYIAFVPGVQQQLSIQSYQTDCSNEMAMGIRKCKRWLLYY